MFYKLTIDENIVDVLSEPQYVKMDKKLGIVLRCNPKEAEGVLDRKSGEIFSLGKNEELNNKYRMVSVTEFDDEEVYNSLLKALEELGTVEEQKPQEEYNDVDLDFAKKGKIEEMSKKCETEIKEGFDIVDEEGHHHYSLELTDQMMISMLAIKVSNGVDFAPWHADNEPCRMYSKQEILTLNECMEQLIVYHQTYFNSLKMYINSLKTCSDINNIYYGIDIPEEFKSEVLKGL